jgi:hypothetical protein
MKCIFVFTVSLFATMGLCGQERHSPTPVLPVNPIQPVLNVLKAAKTTGSLQFRGKCESFDYPGFPDFPPMVDDNPTLGSPVQRLVSIFSEDPSMEVHQAPDGSIEMMEIGIPQDVLNITIADINFSGPHKSVVNNPNGAVNFVLHSPEVQNYIALHSISFPYPVSMASGILGGAPDPRLPQISSSFHNVTVRFLLNQIAKTLQSVWIYENCPTSAKGSRVVYIRFYKT